MKPYSSSIWEILPSEVTRPSLEHDTFWGAYIRKAVEPAIHIAILSKFYLDLILENYKTIESRFSVNRCIPYNRVQKGDVLLLKVSGGPIMGVGYVSRVWFYELTDGTLDTIKQKFGSKLQITDPEFWGKYQKSSYATLIKLNHVRRIEPIKYSKRDQRAWVTFNSAKVEHMNS
jgi:hypothetical protein